jgi:hypothetical protein
VTSGIRVARPAPPLELFRVWSLLVNAVGIEQLRPLEAVSEARPDNALLNIQRAAVGSGSGGEGLQYLADKLLISPDELVKLVFGLGTLGLPSNSGGAKRPSTKPKIACGDIAELCTKVR